MVSEQFAQRHRAPLSEPLKPHGSSLFPASEASTLKPLTTSSPIFIFSSEVFLNRYLSTENPRFDLQSSMEHNPSRGDFSLGIGTTAIPFTRFTVNACHRVVRSSPLQLNYNSCSTGEVPPPRVSSAASTGRPPPLIASATSQTSAEALDALTPQMRSLHHRAIRLPISFNGTCAYCFSSTRAVTEHNEPPDSSVNRELEDEIQ